MGSKESYIKLVSGEEFLEWKPKGSNLPHVDVTFGEYMACCEVAQAVSEKFLRQHERNGHFYMPGFHVNCPACALGKDLNKTSHKKQRPAHLIPVRFLSQVDWDFKGPYPESWFGRRWVLS